MKKSKSNASKKQLEVSGDHKSVRANEPILPNQPQELRVNAPTTSIIGFNGQLFDSVSGTYLLGNGYRAYSPSMRAFYSPDSLSPFGAGGVSRYQYCNLNPVNYADPSGHSVVGAAIGIIGILSTITAGVSVGFEIGRRANSESNPEYSAYLRELSIGFGTASAVLGIVAGVSGVARFVARSRRVLPKGVTWGRVTEKYTSTEGIKFFSDIPKGGGSRLNFVAHGEMWPIIGQSSSIPAARGFFSSYGPDDIFAMMVSRYGDDLTTQFNSIRSISCYSANGGSKSFGQKLANLSRLPVRAYKGPVMTADPDDPIVGKLYQIFKPSMGPEYSNVNHVPRIFKPQL